MSIFLGRAEESLSLTHRQQTPLQKLKTEASCQWSHGQKPDDMMEIHHVFFFPLCDLFVCSNQQCFLHYHHWHSEVLATPQFPTSFQQGPVLTNSQCSICDPNDGLTASKQLTSSTATTMRKRSSHQGCSWYLVVSCGISTTLYISLHISAILSWSGRGWIVADLSTSRFQVTRLGVLRCSANERRRPRIWQMLVASSTLCKTATQNKPIMYLCTICWAYTTYNIICI